MGGVFTVTTADRQRLPNMARKESGTYTCFVFYCRSLAYISFRYFVLVPLEQSSLSPCTAPEPSEVAKSIDDK